MAHWRVPADVLRPLVPTEFELDTFDNETWVSLVPFRMRNVRFLGTPHFGRLSNFPEINVRTYVRYRDIPGVYFFSLDTTSRALVTGARGWANLPYFLAHIAMSYTESSVAIRSERRQRQVPPARLATRYRPIGPAAVSRHGTLAHFLAERYRVYSVGRSGQVIGLGVQHGPWLLAEAEARFRTNSMLTSAGLDVGSAPDLLHYSARQDVLLWAPRALQLQP